jgi:hypothetical protein
LIWDCKSDSSESDSEMEWRERLEGSKYSSGHIDWDKLQKQEEIALEREGELDHLRFRHKRKRNSEEGYQQECQTESEDEFDDSCKAELESETDLEIRFRVNPKLALYEEEMDRPLKRRA